MKKFITIGAFDGVHAGHIHLINRLKSIAKENAAAPLYIGTVWGYGYKWEA